MLLRKPGLSCKLRYKNYALELAGLGDLPLQVGIEKKNR